MKITRLMIPIFLLTTILLSSCNLSASNPPATPTLQPGLNNNTLLQTIDALSTQSTSSQTTITPASTDIVAATAAVNPTDTEIVEPTQPATVVSTPAPTQPGGIPVVPITPIATLSRRFTSSGFAITHIIMGVDSADVTTSCPTGHNFTFTGDIQSNGPGTITYYWDFSNGTKSPEQMLNFSSVSAQKVSATWDLGAKGPESSNPFKGSVRIYVDAPNHQFFSNEDITLTCNSSASPSSTPGS
ncbi:MAG: hypothetical protein P4L50_22190 [Anaerolineaceae bacterium]|nr:hypothetical protein [Anaerolineaceae bacterium]